MTEYPTPPDARGGGSPAYQVIAHEYVNSMPRTLPEDLKAAGYDYRDLAMAVWVAERRAEKAEAEVELMRQAHVADERNWVELYGRAEKAEADLEAEREEHAKHCLESSISEYRLTQRAEEAEAELEFQRRWCRDALGYMPPSRELNDRFMEALEATEGNDQ